MWKVGITGGIGSGKSYVCEVFRNLNIPVFNADDVANNIIENDPEIKVFYKNLFGNDIYGNGQLNRVKVAKKVFNDDQLLRQVNQAIHPVVFKKFNNWVKENEKHPYVIKEAAIIFESGAEKELDFVITISAPEELRLKRVMHRDQVDRKTVKARIRKQWTEEDRIKHADFVIVNDEKTLLLPQVLEIHQKLIRQK